MRQVKFEGGNCDVKIWDDFVKIEEGSIEQFADVSRLPFVNSVCAMPDSHLGVGASIGSVVVTDGAICPALVGVDVGCGMRAVKTCYKVEDFTDEDLEFLYAELLATIPVGRTNYGRENDKGAWQSIDAQPYWISEIWNSYLNVKYEEVLDDVDNLGFAKKVNDICHLGTLGTGNHFIEICQDTKGFIWVLIHSGSRGVGNTIASFYIEYAKKMAKKWMIKLPTWDLAYLPKDTKEFDAYMKFMRWANSFAYFNRAVMSTLVGECILNTVLQSKISREINYHDKAMNLELDDFSSVDCVHNFIEIFRYNGKNRFVTRKGAIRVTDKVLGIIPSAMGGVTYIVNGTNNYDSVYSASHGAGRAMSRTKARKNISFDKHLEDVKDVICRKDEGVLDETPSAYKNFDDVIKSEKDLINIKETLKALICVKG